MAHLVVQKGPNSGQVIPLADKMILGRSMEADIHLDDLTVSRRHARMLQNERGQFAVEDMGSGNGTFVNGSMVSKCVLKDGDIVAFGSVECAFHDETGKQKKPAAGETTLEVLEDDDKSSSTAVVNTIDVAAAREEISEDSSVEQLLNANKRLQILYDIFNAIGTNLDEEELLAQMLESLFEVFPETHSGFIILKDSATGELTPQAVKSESGGKDARISATIANFVLEKKQAVLSRDAMHDDRFSGAESVVGQQMRSMMCAPLMNEGEVLGFILLETQRVSRNYDNDGLALLAGIANQAGLFIANARLHSQLLSRQRIEQDLKNATSIQKSFLPERAPQIQGYQFKEWYRTAWEVGGDFYDYIPLPDGKLGVVVGDVSGKGVPAALMMAKMTGHARFRAASGLRPAEVMRALNEAVVMGEPELFVTLIYMCLDWCNHNITLCNGGHCPPVLRKADGSIVVIEGGRSYPLGIVEEADFPEETFTIETGDRLCVFTDGIIEAMNSSREQYGNKRLETVISESPPHVETIVQKIQESVEDFTEGVPQSDDLTLICLGPAAETDAQENAQDEDGIGEVVFMRT